LSLPGYLGTSVEGPRARRHRQLDRAGVIANYSVELFQGRTGIKVVHIPFKGGAPSTAAVVSGEVDFSFANITDVRRRSKPDRCAA
jgi:tripartite-type tricarboxylate transporter receptor subunit TctC